VPRPALTCRPIGPAAIHPLPLKLRGHLRIDEIEKNMLRSEPGVDIDAQTISGLPFVLVVKEALARISHRPVRNSPVGPTKAAGVRRLSGPPRQTCWTLCIVDKPAKCVCWPARKRGDNTPTVAKQTQVQHLPFFPGT